MCKDEGKMRDKITPPAPLSTDQGICSTFYMKMYRYIVHNCGRPWEKFLKCIFRFLHLLIRGLIKALSPEQAISVLFLQKCTTKLWVVIRQREEYFRSISQIFTPTNQGLVERLSTNSNLAIRNNFSLEMYSCIQYVAP